GSFDFQLWRSSENDLPALAEYLAQMPTSYVASLIRGTFGLTLHRAESKAETKACYLNIKKPFDLDSKSGTELDPDEVDRIMQVAADMGYMGDHPRNGRPFYVYDALLQCRNIAILNQGQTVPLRSKMSKADANKVLRRVGYDGITHIGGNLMGGGEKQHRVWIAFEPNQVKAIDNEGGFTDSDNIYEAAAEYDWRKAVADAGAFDDILNVFDNIFSFGKYRFAQSLLREAQTKKVHAAIAMLESGNPEPEARYFALSQIQSLLYASDIGSDEAASIRAKYDDQFAGKEKALSDHYAGKGEEAKRAAGIQDAIQQHAALGEEIKAIVARHVEAIDRIHAEFAPALSEANAKHIEPLIQKKDIAQRAYEEKRTELINRRPSADKVQSQLSPEEYTKFVEWQNESGKLHREFAAEQQVIIDELRWAKFTYITPIEHEELLKQGNAVNEIGDTGQLREDQKGIAKEAHAKLMAHLLEQSPVTEEQATEWISQNAIMDKNAIAKAKKAGYDPKDVTKDLVEFYRITGGRLPRLAYATTRNARSMASPHAGNLYVGSSFGKKTFFHELAHLLEGDPKIFNCAQQFLGRRAESSQTYSLSSLTKNSNYRGDERAYKDKWIDPYVGKVYPDATEVFSMGMSTLADPESLINVLNKDPEHLSLMLGVCLSKPYIDEDRKQVLQGEVREKKANIQKTDDFYKEIDKKIAKAGNFWEGHIVAITPQTKYGATRPSSYILSYETKKNSQTYSVFKSEKDMKRALYLWISNDKPPAGPFSINELNYTLGYKKNLLPKEFLNFPIREVPN
ncbi:MAG: hypothetical protein WCK00_09155, partial [Deltaproteobacteria bacterium]